MALDGEIVAKNHGYLNKGKVIMTGSTFTHEKLLLTWIDFVGVCKTSQNDNEESVVQIW